MIANQKISPLKKLIRKIRQQLYYCGRFGLEDHCEREDLTPKEFFTQIYGMLGYVGLTQPAVADEFKIQLLKIQKGVTFASPEEEEDKFLTLV